MSRPTIFLRKLFFSLLALSFATQDAKPTSRVFLMELRELRSAVYWDQDVET
jgi:hypothetical protein